MNRYPEYKYSNTQNTSIKQQNEAEYTESEYDDTQKMSMASKLIRVQGEQIRRITAEEFIKSKRIKMSDGSRR